MEVQSGVQHKEPRPLGSPPSGANQQDEQDDSQTDAGGRASSDSHSKDSEAASHKDDRRVSYMLPPACVCVCERVFDEGVCGSLGVSVRVSVE